MGPEHATALNPAVFDLARLGYQIYATPESAAFLRTSGIDVTEVQYDGATALVKGGGIGLVVNINTASTAGLNNTNLRRAAVDHGVTLCTNPMLAAALVLALTKYKLTPESLTAYSAHEYYAQEARARVKAGEVWV